MVGEGWRGREMGTKKVMTSVCYCKQALRSPGPLHVNTDSFSHECFCGFFWDTQFLRSLPCILWHVPMHLRSLLLQPQCILWSLFIGGPLRFFHLTRQTAGIGFKTLSQGSLQPLENTHKGFLAIEYIYFLVKFSVLLLVSLYISQMWLDTSLCRRDTSNLLINFLSSLFKVPSLDLGNRKYILARSPHQRKQGSTPSSVLQNK